MADSRSRKGDRQSPLREIPAVHRLTTDPAVAAYEGLLGRELVHGTVTAVLETARSKAEAGDQPPALAELRASVLELLSQHQRRELAEVVNGTGVLLHTNFGRAPLATAALAHASTLAAGYTNLEYDVVEGKRGSRYEHVAAALRELSGAQAALVVNNCAAAVLLVLDTFARDREVVVSRGQLIEIGGGFRLPDVLAKSGAKLVEVGTTNKTYLSDYRKAWSERTAMFMRSHPSNYRVSGFVAEVDAQMLSTLAKELNVISFEDLGSGALVDLAQFGLAHEPTIKEELAAGIDLVAVSGDKLLGGPQCGIICGTQDLVETLKRNPLLRALRVDKLTLAALGATLRFYLEPGRLAEIPFFAMLATPLAKLRDRAQRICAVLHAGTRAITLSECTSEATTGGGTLPLQTIPSVGIAVSSRELSPNALADRLRRGTPPVVGTIGDAAVVIDLRTVRPDQDGAVIRALQGLPL
jgi:L-seryl-tRNA(Ser) seleniumtransferase